MKQLSIALLALLLFAQSAHAAFAIVTDVAEVPEFVPAEATTGSTAFTSGNQLVALIYWRSATATLNSVVYDPGGGNQTSLTAVGSVVSASFGSMKLHIYRLCNIPTTASKTVRATWSATMGGAAFMKVFEISGGDTSGCDDANNSSTGTSATASTSVSVTTNNAAIFAVAASGNGELTAGSGYTLIGLGNTSLWNTGEYNLDVGSAGAKTVDMGLSGGSGDWAIKAAAFKSAGGGAAAAIRRRRTEVR